MEFFIIVAALILSQNYTPVQSAPSIEACPADSILSEDQCICNPESCVEPPCLSELRIAVNSSDTPGSCCPIYECVDCRNDTLINDKCPCAPDAVLNENNQCLCVDEQKHLVNGECICNPLQCPIPPLCDKKSVPISIDDGCCKKTKCEPCPSDSESSHQDSDDIEDHCVCLPCKKECGNNRTAVVKKHASGFPGNCCDLYECKQLDEIKVCQVGDTVYQNDEEWLSPHQQKCKCQNGLSFCTKTLEEKSQSCIDDQKVYKHLDEWYKDGGCSHCKCINGDQKCISYYCETKESRIQKNESQSCYIEDRVYQHFENWVEKDGCTRCTCINGKEQCTQEFCFAEPTHTKTECQPLANCNKTCTTGFKINKKGCEICKCNSIRFTQDILFKYNITMKDLLAIVEDYINHKTSTTTTSTISPVNPPFVEVTDAIYPSIINMNGNLLEETSTTTEPSVVPTDSGYWNIAIPILALLSFACVVFFIIIVMCIYKSRRKSSMDLTHCHYETVNNNTIKKTDQLL